MPMPMPKPSQVYAQLHLLGPRTGKLRYLNLCLDHLQSRQTGKPSAEAGLPVFTRVARCRLCRGTAVLARGPTQVRSTHTKPFRLGRRQWPRSRARGLLPGGARRSCSLLFLSQVRGSASCAWPRLRSAFRLLRLQSSSTRLVCVPPVARRRLVRWGLVALPEQCLHPALNRRRPGPVASHHSGPSLSLFRNPAPVLGRRRCHSLLLL